MRDEAMDGKMKFTFDWLEDQASWLGDGADGETAKAAAEYVQELHEARATIATLTADLETERKANRRADDKIASLELHINRLREDRDTKVATLTAEKEASENQAELLREDIECVHLWLDDKGVPRIEIVEQGKCELSIVGRIMEHVTTLTAERARFKDAARKYMQAVEKRRIHDENEPPLDCSVEEHRAYYTEREDNHATEVIALNELHALMEGK